VNVTTAVLIALAMAAGGLAPQAPAQLVSTPPIAVQQAEQSERPQVERAPEQSAAFTQKRRNQIQLMEGVLARAGSIAAEAFGHQLQQVEPGMTVTIGQSRARGFVLEGHGIFFDVEVPELRGTVVWSQMMMQRDLELTNALALLQRALQEMPEGPSRQQAQRAVQVLAAQTGPVQQNRSRADAQDPAIRVNEAANVSEPTDPAAPTPSVAVAKDPSRAYRDTVQRELIDAMLDHSLAMDLGPDEWLIVAARVSEAGQRGQTLMMRALGSDLAIYAADKSRRGEIRGKVEVRVF
jgi:hypothetical protein